MFRVGNVDDRFSFVFDAVARRPVGVVEPRRRNPDVVKNLDIFAGLEIVIPQVRLHGIKGDGKHRVVHLGRQDVLDAVFVAQVACHDGDGVSWNIGRSEKRETVDMVPMGVGEQNV